MLVKIHKSYREVVAICDKELLGKKFEQDKSVLEVTDFFNGDEINEKELIDLMKNHAAEDATFNIIGEKSIQAALKAGIITQAGIRKVQDIPFALVLL